MSIKIYNGYRLPLLDTPALFDLFHQFAAKARALKDQETLKRFARVVAEVHDERWLKPSLRADGKSAFGVAWKLLDYEFTEFVQKGRRGSLYDYGCNVSFAPSPNNDKMLVILYTERKELREMWESFEVVEPFPYWNNTDPPEGMESGEGYKQWEARGAEWMALFSGRFGHSPAEAMFNFDVASPAPPLIFEAAAVVKNLPSLDERVEKTARTTMVGEALDAVGQQVAEPVWLARAVGNEAVAKVQGALDKLRITADVVRYLETDEGKQVLAVKMAELRPRLKPSLTQEDILRKEST